MWYSMTCEICADTVTRDAPDRMAFIEELEAGGWEISDTGEESSRLLSVRCVRCATECDCDD